MKLGDFTTLSIDGESTRTLVDLGLTNTQARVYLALLLRGTSLIKEIARVSGVARPDTYRAITELQERGLVEKLLTVPTKFKPLTIEEAIGILMLRKTRENMELTERANRLIKSFETKKKKAPEIEESQFILVPSGETLQLRAQKMMENAQELISIVAPRRRIHPFLRQNLDLIKKTLKRKVIIRVITDKAKQNTVPEILELEKLKMFEITYVATEQPVLFILADDKEILLITSAQFEYSASTAFWSNNPGLIELAQGYFELTWSTLASNDDSTPESATLS